MRLRVWRELSRRAQRCAAAHTPDSWASLVDAMPCVLREDKIFGSLEVKVTQNVWSIRIEEWSHVNFMDDHPPRTIVLVTYDGTTFDSTLHT